MVPGSQVREIRDWSPRAESPRMPECVTISVTHMHDEYTHVHISELHRAHSNATSPRGRYLCVSLSSRPASFIASGIPFRNLGANITI